MSYKRLTKSYHDRVIAGVCGGIGEHFAVDPLWVRILFIVFVFFSGFSIFVYLGLLLIMPQGQQSNMRIAYKGFYRSRNNAILAGVCGAFSERLDIDVTWIRLGFILSVFFSFGWAIVAYFGIWLLTTVES